MYVTHIYMLQSLDTQQGATKPFRYGITAHRVTPQLHGVLSIETCKSPCRALAVQDSTNRENTNTTVSERLCHTMLDAYTVMATAHHNA
jgi:hypothetical protein